MLLSFINSATGAKATLFQDGRDLEPTLKRIEAKGRWNLAPKSKRQWAKICRRSWRRFKRLYPEQAKLEKECLSQP